MSSRTLDLDKPLHTRMGRPVRLYERNCPGKYPLRGYYKTLYGWSYASWTREGDYVINSETPFNLDLINVTEAETSSERTVPAKVACFENLVGRQLTDEPVDFNKPLQTRCGYPVKIRCVWTEEGAIGDYPVYGAYEVEGRWQNAMWTEDGRYFAKMDHPAGWHYDAWTEEGTYSKPHPEDTTSLDLINVPAEKTDD